MRPVALLALALCTCKPAPAPEPKPVEPAAPPPVARVEPPPAQPDAEPPPAAPEQCKCPADPVAAAAPAEQYEEDEETAKERAARTKETIPKPLADKLRIAFPELRPACDVTLSGPCNIRGDLDGDRAPDDVILVRNKDGAGGLAILYAAGPTDLLGAGRRGACWTATEIENIDGTSDVAPCLEEVEPNLNWIAGWDLRPRKKNSPVLTDPRRKRTFKAPGALGDGLQLSGMDAAVALYRTATGWTLMHLGF